MLYNKSIFITGANRGIGFELVKESLNKNAFVFGTFRNKLKSQELYSIKSHNFNYFQMNVIDEASIKEVSNKLSKPIDFLVCNADWNAEGFNGKMNFSETLIPYECKTDWIPEELTGMLNTLNSETIPEGNISCMNCAYARQRGIVEWVSFRDKFMRISQHLHLPISIELN